MRGDLRWLTSLLICQKASISLNNLQKQRYRSQTISITPKSFLLQIQVVIFCTNMHGGVGIKRTQISPRFLQSIRSDPLRALLGAGTKLGWPTSFVDSKLDLTISALGLPSTTNSSETHTVLYFTLRGERPDTTGKDQELVTSSRKGGSRN